MSQNRKMDAIELCIAVFLALVFNIFDARACFFNRTFGIPCPGCGLTRAGLLILKGNILESMKYSIVPEVLFGIMIFYGVVRFLLKKDFAALYKEHQTLFVFILVSLFAFIWIVNLTNPRL